MGGKCPHCKAFISRVTLGNIEVAGTGTNTWKGLSYSCSACGNIISVGIDPIALKADIEKEVLRGLKKKKG